MFVLTANYTIIIEKKHTLNRPNQYSSTITNAISALTNSYDDKGYHECCFDKPIVF